MNGTKLEGKIGRIDHTDLKAKCLDIVVKKNVNIYQIKYMETLDDYNAVTAEEDLLSQEEFELLKEVLE